MAVDPSQSGAIGEFSIGVSPIGGGPPVVSVSAFAPSYSDLLLDAYGRIQIRPTGLTSEHMHDALMSAQLLLVDWSTKPSVPNLWKIQLFSTTLIQGVPSYPVPSNVVGILDYYLRQYQVGPGVSLTHAFSTESGSATVAVHDPANGVIPGDFVSIIIPVAIDDLALFGLYQVASVIDADNYTITASAPATAGVLAGGVVPMFTTTAGSADVVVEFPRHGLSAGQNFAVQVTMMVGGLVISGIYEVATVVDADHFAITSPYVAGSSASVYENAGSAIVATQVANQQLNDIVMTPMSRTDYASQPNKLQQARPTSVWWNRQINSVVNLWPTPDANGPYVLFYYALVNIDSAAMVGGVKPDLPYRFLEAFTAGLAAKLAEKYPPPAPNTVEAMETRAEKRWQSATMDDVEDVPLRIIPSLGGYYRR